MAPKPTVEPAGRMTRSATRQAKAAEAVQNPTPAPATATKSKTKPKKSAVTKKPAASNARVKKPPAVKGPGADKKLTKAQLDKQKKAAAKEKRKEKADAEAKKKAEEEGEDEEEEEKEEEEGEDEEDPKKPKKPTKKLPKKTKDKKKKKGKHVEAEKPNGDGEEGEEVPNPPGGPTLPGGGDDPAPDPAPPTVFQEGGEGGQVAQPPPVTDEEILQAAAAITLRRRLNPNELLGPPSRVTYEVEPIPDEVRHDPPGYDGAREWLARLILRPSGCGAFAEAAFATAPDVFPYKGAQWVWAKEIGRGSYGRADLYLQLGPNGNIVQRIIVKTTQIPHEMWTQARRWHIDPLDPAKAQHMEIAVMKAIADVDELEHKCVRLQHYTTDGPTFSYRMYIGYHPRGDLGQFTKKSFYNFRDKIPEPALWKWFEDLTEASLLLSTGAEPGADAKDGWKQIVHCDLKPANVFLDNPDEKRWRSYPQAILGDFGLAVFTDENDPFNPTWYNADGAGTDGWFPAEQVQYVEPTSKRLTDTGKLGDASNVWAIGAIIMRLMNTDKDPIQPGYDEEVAGMMEPRLNDGAKKFYSTFLCDLVDECVRFRTYNRIELPVLWTRIQRFTGEADVEHDPDVDGGNEGDFQDRKREVYEQKFGDGDDDFRLEYPEEEYKILDARTQR